MSLDKWFVKKDIEGNVMEPFFLTFYLDGQTMQATWLRNKPKDCNYSESVRWPGIDNTINLVAKLDSSPRVNLPIEEYYNNVPYLKSHLQKAIRRSNTIVAMKTAHHLARLDLQNLVRRLAIIVLEDVMLVPEWNALIWLTAALSKGFCLDQKRLYWLFGLVYKLAHCDVRDPYYLARGAASAVAAGAASAAGAAGAASGAAANDAEEPSTEAVGEWKKWKLYKLKDQDKGIIQSILFRESYGGTKGDKRLIIEGAKIWMDRLSGEQGDSLTLFKQDTKTYYVSPPEENLLLTEWILPAIDFHVVTNITMILGDKYEQFHPETIRETIWHLSSKWNNKKILGPYLDVVPKREYTDVWKTIRPEFYSLAHYFLKNNF